MALVSAGAVTAADGGAGLGLATGIWAQPVKVKMATAARRRKIVFIFIKEISRSSVAGRNSIHVCDCIGPFPFRPAHFWIAFAMPWPVGQRVGKIFLQMELPTG